MCVATKSASSGVTVPTGCGFKVGVFVLVSSAMRTRRASLCVSEIFLQKGLRVLTNQCMVPFLKNAGWSSLVARQAHNLKVAGSNPAPATSSKSLAKRVLRSKKDLAEADIKRNQSAPECTKMTVFGPELGPELGNIRVR